MSVPPPRCLRVEEGDAGSRLDVFLADRLALSRAQVRRLLERGAVSRDGRPAAKGERLAAGSEIRVEAFRPPGDWRAAPEPEAPLAVLAEGPGWLAVDKPAGVPVHPLKEGETGTLLNALVARRPEVYGVGEGGLRSGVVHRLDVETSGALLFATEEACWQRLRRAFSEHEVEKVYRAIVRGRLEGSGSVALPLVLARHRPAKVRVLDPDAAPPPRSARVCELAFRPLEIFGDATLVEVRPKQGFLHQIRVSLAHLGHPVAGDRTYGPPADATGAGRHMLHAARVAWQDVAAESPDAPDFAETLARLRRPS